MPAAVQRRHMSPDCQRMKNDGRPALLNSWLAAARNTRSLSSSRGRATWRRRTASSWRSTTISSSLNSRDRNRRAATASTRRNSRYNNDTTKRQPPPPESEEADSTVANPSSETPDGITYPTRRGRRALGGDRRRCRRRNSQPGTGADRHLRPAADCSLFLAQKRGLSSGAHQVWSLLAGRGPARG